MPKYFMRDTPHRNYELMMMAVPNFRPRGHGFLVSVDKYDPKDLDCGLCADFRGKPCPLNRCRYLPERIKAGDVSLQQLAYEFFAGVHSAGFHCRLREYLKHPAPFFRNAFHRMRWEEWRRIYPDKAKALPAALFLLSAYDVLWTRTVPMIGTDRIHFDKVRLGNIDPDQYAVYQAAKAIFTKTYNITFADLADPEIISDEAFRLIVSALLLARYGKAIFLSERLEVDQKCSKQY